MLISRILNGFINKWVIMQKKLTHGVESTRDAVFRGGVIVLSAILIVWLSVFFYTAFYYAYMPSMTHVRPVHLVFRSCDMEKGICSFPSAIVELTNKQQLLMVGQPYKINLHLEMPESPANKELGMFMVCAKLQTRDGHIVEQACRSAMLHYRSTLLHMLSTLTFSPMMIFGTTEEKQNIVLELFGNFEEDQSHPVTNVHIQIESMHIEFYSASIMINAHLSGLRYLMFHWPILSAIVGIGTHLFFIALICILSYLRFAMDEDSTDENFSYEKGKVEEEKDMKALGDILSDSSSMEEIPASDDLPNSEEESQSSRPAEPVIPEFSSYIQEISSLIAESSSAELVK